jgi:hypothetical protein
LRSAVGFGGVELDIACEADNPNEAAMADDKNPAGAFHGAISDAYGS